MSLPEGKAIYLIAFSLLLSYIRKLTDLLIYLLLMVIVNAYIFMFIIVIFALTSSCHCILLRIFAFVIKNRYYMEKYYLCSIQSKVNPNQNETILVPVDEVSEFVSSHLRPDCVLIISQCSTFKAITDEK